MADSLVCPHTKRTVSLKIMLIISCHNKISGWLIFMPVICVHSDNVHSFLLYKEKQTIWMHSKTMMLAEEEKFTTVKVLLPHIFSNKTWWKLHCDWCGVMPLFCACAIFWLRYLGRDDILLKCKCSDLFIFIFTIREWHIAFIVHFIMCWTNGFWLSFS